MTIIETNNSTPINANGLTADQAEAARTLDRYKAEGEKLTALLGYAGTGKTELTLRRIQHVIDTCSNPRILVVAPTHKALSNLWDKAKHRVTESPYYTPIQFSDKLGAQLLDEPDNPLPNCQVVYFTVAQALGKERVEDDETGETYFAVAKEPEIEDFFTHCFIDEISMVGASDWALLQQYVFPHCMTEVVGDPAQLPPVNDGAESPAFKIPHKATLTHVVRNAGGILKNSFQFREAMHKPGILTPLIDEYDNVIQKDWEPFIDEFVRLHQAGYNCRAITYRNSERAKLNTILRERILGSHIGEFEPGEKVTAVNTTPIKQPNLKTKYDIRNFSMYSTQEGTVETVQLWEYEISDEYRNPEYFDKRFSSFPRKFDHDRLYYWFLEVMTDEGDLMPVRQIHHSSRDDLQRMRDSLRTWIKQSKKHRDDNDAVRHNIDQLNMEIQNTQDAQALESLEKRKDKQKAKFQYKDSQNPKYERFMNNPKMHAKQLIYLNDFFHNLQYSYAITTHKSQGSTYDYAFLHSDDLYTNSKKMECLQLLYVAVTRPSEGIYFCEDRSPSMLTEEESQAIEQEANTNNP
jgi:hypothetical protein